MKCERVAYRLQNLNSRIFKAERSFLGDKTLSGHGWYRHIISSPSKSNQYGGIMFSFYFLFFLLFHWNLSIIFFIHIFFGFIRFPRANSFPSIFFFFTLGTAFPALADAISIKDWKQAQFLVSRIAMMINNTAESFSQKFLDTQLQPISWSLIYFWIWKKKVK